MAMSSRKRILSAFFLEEPDRVPFSPFVNASWLEAGGTSKTGNMLKWTDLLIVHGRMARNIFLGEKAREAMKVSREGNLVKTVIETPKGRLRSTMRRTPRMSLVKEYFLKSFDDVDKFLSVPYQPPKIDPSDYLRWSKRVGDEGLVLTGTPNAVVIAATNGFGPANFCMRCLQDLSRVKEFVAIGAERVEHYVESVIDAGTEAVRVCGAEHACPTFLHPRFFKDLVVPFDKRLMHLIKDKGAIAYMHCHGRIRGIINMIKEIDPDALDPIERPLGGDVDIAYVKKMLGNKICLVGNLDLEVYSPPWPKIKEELLKCISMAAEGGGYLLGGTTSSGAVYTEKVYENFVKGGKFVRGVGSYPVKRA